MTDPSALSVAGGFVLFLAAVFALTLAWLLTARAFKTPAPTRPAAQRHPKEGAR